MHILKWAAVAVTALFVLMNLGAVADPELAPGYRIAGVALALLGLVAVAGLAWSRTWGRPSTIAAGAANTLAAITTLFTGSEGALIGIVVGGLGLVLGLLVAPGPRRPQEAHAS